MSNSTADRRTHQNHLVHVRTMEAQDGSWNYTIDIQTPEGEWLPPIKNREEGYERADEALAAGMAAGIEQVDFHIARG